MENILFKEKKKKLSSWLMMNCLGFALNGPTLFWELRFAQWEALRWQL